MAANIELDVESLAIISHPIIVTCAVPSVYIACWFPPAVPSWKIEEFVIVPPFRNLKAPTVDVEE